MLYSTTTCNATPRFGIEEGVEKLIDAGFPALDFGLKGDFSFIYDEGVFARFENIRKMANGRGVIFNQAHAPFGGGYKRYTEEIIPALPKIFELCATLGAENIIVHPIQNGRYYGNEEMLFDLNMRFYRSIAPAARNAGIKISIENMWQRHPQTKHIIDDVCADPYELVRYHDTLDDPDTFNICLDIGHVALCGREPEDAVRIIGHDRLGALHVHDVDYKTDLHTLPGLANIDFDAVCRALGEIDYTGVFTLECDGEYHKATDKVFLPIAYKFMNDTAKFYADKVEKYRIKA